MLVNNNQIGDYPVDLNFGNEDFKKLVDELWTPCNPKGVNSDSMRWVKCCFLCNNLFPLMRNECNNDVILKGWVSEYLCKTLIYGWSKPLDDSLYLSHFWIEDYLGIPHGEPWIYGQSNAYAEIEQGFNLVVWQELKPFLLALGEVPNIDAIKEAGKAYFMEVLVQQRQ
ncbi:MAG: hypothetical protein EOM28_03205 [Clostridia bacterium]|nr:hypothetical protein [Clostridia bacterium]